MLSADHKYSMTEKLRRKKRKKERLSALRLAKEGKARVPTNLSPLEPPLVVDRAVHAPREAAEPPKVADDCASDDEKDNQLCALGEAAGGEDEVVEHVCGHEDAKVERRELR
jgi:hypothetical protein